MKRPISWLSIGASWLGTKRKIMPIIASHTHTLWLIQSGFPPVHGAN